MLPSASLRILASLLIRPATPDNAGSSLECEFSVAFISFSPDAGESVDTISYSPDDGLLAPGSKETSVLLRSVTRETMLAPRLSATPVYSNSASSTDAGQSVDTLSDSPVGAGSSLELDPSFA
jgi:hypothetical protein